MNLLRNLQRKTRLKIKNETIRVNLGIMKEDPGGKQQVKVARTRFKNGG